MSVEVMVQRDANHIIFACIFQDLEVVRRVQSDLGYVQRIPPSITKKLGS